MLDGLKRVQPATCGWHEGLPDQPDRRAMRMRAHASEPKLVSTEKREPSDHEQMLEATGHRQLAELAFAGARGTQELVTHGVQTLKKALRRPVMGGQLHSMTVEQFIEKYEDDYEIWVSPAVNRKAGLPGNLLFFGEDHDDEEQMQKHKKIVFDLFDVKAGARVMLEGESEEERIKRARDFGIPSASWVNLEEDSPHFDAFNALMRRRGDAVLEAAEFVAKVTPGAARYWPCGGPIACTIFIEAWSNDVPNEHVARLNQIITSANDLEIQSYAELERVRPMRNAWILRQARGYLDPKLFHMGFTGALHIDGLQKLARKTPLITMTERSLWKMTLKIMAEQAKAARQKS
jgi:hypothetical protein